MALDLESDSSNTPADDAQIEGAIRQAVIDAFTNGDQVTVNLARAQAEKALGLADGFFKSHPRWKDKSKQVVTSAVEEDEDVPVLKSSPKLASNKTASAALRASKKRNPTAEGGEPQKRQKRAVSEESEEVSIEPVATKQNSKSKPSGARQQKSVVSDESKEEAKHPQDSAGTGHGNAAGVESDDLGKNIGEASLSESEMSDVRDEPVQRAKKRQKPEARSKSTKPKVLKVDKDKDLGPDEAEIKRLQSWLLKCGIRKLWHKELAPYETTKAKIRHLKEMLKDVGMDGRYSAEKASAIKERRELAADLEAVQEGNKQWGKESGSGEEDVGGEEEPEINRSRRRAAATRFVDFGEDGEESD